MKKRSFTLIICLILALSLLTSCAGGCDGIGQAFNSISTTISSFFQTISDNLSGNTPPPSSPSGTPSGSQPSGSEPSGSIPEPTPDPTPEPIDPPVIDEDQYEINGNKITFGSYPQEQANSFLNAQLSFHYATDLPTSTNSYDWTRFNYYENGEEDGLDAWYKDITYSGDKYRGVYFTEYRPYMTSLSGEENSMQDDNGYSIVTDHVYWFKFTPVTWTILEMDDEQAYIICDNILDAQYFYPDLAQRTIDENTVFANNWEHSYIRSWLNNQFLNTCFNELEKLHLVSTTVDCTDSTTAFENNTMISNDTIDKIFLLSYQESVKSSYGFSSAFVVDTEKTKLGSAYAKALGLSSNCWWLRSPHLSINGVSRVYQDGKVHAELNADANVLMGVVPAVRIYL